MIWIPLILSAAIGPLSLESLDGKELVVSNYAERCGTVLVCLSARCPAEDEAIQEINDTYERYRHEGILFVGLFANQEETSAEILSFCQRSGVRFPFYRDPDGNVERRLGAKFTTEAFLLDEASHLVYHDSFQNAEATSRFNEAITCLIQKQSVPESQPPTQGSFLTASNQPREIDDPYGSLAFSSELIFEHIPNAPAHHCATLTEAPNGDLLCVWYGGSYECADDQALFMARRRKGERQWGVPEILISGGLPHPPGNAVVFRVGPNRIGLMWGRMEGSRPMRRGLWNDCRLMFRYSDDNGVTWSSDKELHSLATGLPRNVPIILRNGKFLLPLDGGKSFVTTTEDDGLTWQRLGEISKGGQPTLIERNEGTILALLRSSPKILKCLSTDQGKTWSEPVVTELNCPDAGIAMCRLNHGNVILVFNDSPEERSPLCITRSVDEGETWETPLTLESNPGEYSYPCVIQASDGKIHISYTYRRYSIMHVELNEGWLLHQERPN
jgi:predicted neuraminidase